MEHRPTWDDYFLEMAGVVARGPTCLRRCAGALLVRDRGIFATCYNGAPTSVEFARAAPAWDRSKDASPP
ncbi:MAG: hypothetical protein JSV79_11275 [Armatimonadota bacterium]|nr:MAG: hypothetical protein JSV79_11275 [Armatimonadota bacterium]